MNVYSDGDKISLFDLEDRLISSCEKVKDHPAVIFKQSSLISYEDELPFNMEVFVEDIHF
jgi:hypothetical protein